MAESTVQVTEGSGKKLHTFQRTIGSNNVEDEVVLAGMPYLATYRVGNTGAGTSAATADSHLLQLMAGSTLNVYVTRIRIYQAVLAGALTAGAIQILRLTTAGTGGTALTPSPLDSTDAASGASVMTLPSSKGTEGASIERIVAIYLAAWPTSGGRSSIIAEWDFPATLGKPLRIPAGTANGICVKNPTGVASAQVYVTAEFIEANF